MAAEPVAVGARRARAVISKAVARVVADRFRHDAREREETLMKLNSLRVALAATLLCATLCACVVAAAPGYYGETIYTAPPAAQYEVVGVAPVPGYFWVGGGWFWEGGRYGLHPGYWAAPRPGYHWVPREWARAGGGWRVRGGVWVRR
jgi:hypothetical protein